MKRSTLVMLTLCTLTAVTAFLLTTWAGPSLAPVPRGGSGVLFSWLGLSAEQQVQIRQLDPTFEFESTALSETLAKERTVLASILEQPQASDEEILAQVKRVRGAEEQLEQRVVSYVLKVRPHLNPQQQKLLMGLTAKGVRSAGRCRWGMEGGVNDIGTTGGRVGGGPPTTNTSRGRGYGGPGPHGPATK